MSLRFVPEGIHPKGRPKVYFCCHPEDLTRYFHPLTDLILKKHNCTVWYPGDEKPDLADLAEMQLFVMPVTRRLLTTDNHAMTAEFPLAIAEHIPVLPLMMEDGLNELFNEMCGDLQFLDPRAQDDTTLSFEEKLNKFLDSVLIGDELAARIRAAFDAYIFLSYRKKDRKQAQELMRLIHRNDFCRDLAIWYDEFLVPGENFNDAIRDALKKSGLFVLTVTPNLVNELNYVMTTEYPMAVEAGKTVLPAEIEQTDRGALEEKYADIPPCTDARDETALSQALLNALRCLALRANDNDPEHNFFIGLAYLGGVDVEVDHDRALKLITSSAEAGLLEAYDKLVEMYRTGMGVARNYMTAIHWQEEKVGLLEKRFQKKEDPDTLYALAQACLYCAELWSEQGDENKEYHFIYTADKLLKIWFGITREPAWGKRLLRRFQKPKEREPRLLRLLARCYKWDGQRYENEVDYAAARRLDEELLAIEPTPEAYREVLIDYNQMGMLKLDQENYRAAREWFDKGLALARRMVDAFGTVESRRQYAVTCDRLAVWCKRREDWDGMERWVRESYDLLTALLKESEDPKLRSALSNALFRFGEVCEGRGDLSGARSRYEQALTMDEALLEETGLFKDKKRVAVDCYYLGFLCELEEDIAGAQNWYERAYAIDEALVTATENEDILVACCSDAYALGQLCQEQGELDAAEEWYKKIWRWACHISSRRNRSQSALYKARHCRRMGEIYLLRANYEKADSELINADRFYEETKESGREAHLREYVEYETWRSTHSGYPGTLTPCLESALRVALPLAEKTGALCDRRNLGDVYDELFWDSLDREKFDKAMHWAEKHHALCSALAEETGDRDDRQNLVFACGHMGDAHYALGNHETAREWYQQALQLSRALRKQEETPTVLECVAWYCRKLAKLTPKNRARYLREAEGIYEQLLREFPEDERYRELLRDTHLEE